MTPRYRSAWSAPSDLDYYQQNLDPPEDPDPEGEDDYTDEDWAEYDDDEPDMVTKTRWGFKSKNQLPLFMLWKEHWYRGKVVYANVIFNSIDWIGI